MKIFEKLLELLLNFSRFVQQILTKVVFFIVYIFGIGLTSIAAKMFKKEFLNLNPKNTNWKKPTGSAYREKMY